MKLSALIPALAIVGTTTAVHTQQPVPFEGERHVRVMTRTCITESTPRSSMFRTPRVWLLC